MTFTPEQQAWLEAHIASGEFASVEDALAHLIDTRIAEENGDDLEWAKPLVDEARSLVKQGRAMSREDHQRRMTAHLATLGG